MLSQKEKAFKAHRCLTLEQLVPQDNFYRQLEAKLDLSFVYELVQQHYAAEKGRPAIDPVVFFKLQLIMFFEGLRSERQLMDTVSLNLAHRWYIGYDLDEPVPDHSSLSRIRSRYGVEVFARFFEKIVERCVAAGLVWGKELYFDGTRVRANAALKSLVPRWFWQAKQALRSSDLADEAALAPHAPADDAPTARIAPPSLNQQFLAKYNGQRLNPRNESSYARTADLRVSTTDASATAMSRFTGDRAQMGYHTHYVVDGGKARVILAAFVTPASVMDHTPMLDLVRWVRFRWHLRPQLAVGDSRYGTVPNIVGLEQDGIRAYLAIPDINPRKHLYRADAFVYEAARDRYLCPQGQPLARLTRRNRTEVIVYHAPAAICNACPVKAKCTEADTGRRLLRSFYQAELDRAKAYRHTEAYHKALRKRQVWVEPLFGEGKQWHGMRHFRLRGLEKVNIEGLIRAAGQNIKRLLTARRPSRPQPPPMGAVLLSLLPLSFRCRITSHSAQL